MSSERTIEDQAKIFLEGIYPEIKDLGKQFITLLSGVLALTIAFADRIIDISNASFWQKIILMFCWLSFISAICLIGIGLWWNYNLKMYSLNNIPDQARNIMNFVYSLFILAGFAFVFGLGLLVLAGAFRLFA
jgi:hypothetical protein